jgi:hypothetical protein
VRSIAAQEAGGAAQRENVEVPPVAVNSWHGDYREAMNAAKASGRMLLLWFHDERDGEANDRLSATLEDADLQASLESYEKAKLPMSATVMVDGQPTSVLRHSAFAEMLGRPGIAIVDQRDPESPHFGRVVSVYPFVRGPITLDQLKVLLTLPTGTLTQRTMIFAVRTHPLRPKSAWSYASDMLIHETESHASYQASIGVQGHHRWDQRFQSINARLPAHLVPHEVCAESWPGQTLVEAAEECVDCWRQSSGHWEHVSSPQEMYGYDIKRGRNGIWYAAGIFATRRP